MKINLSFFRTLQGIILIVIIALVAITSLFAFINSTAAANDRKRLTDVEKMQEGLKVYFNVYGYYPSTQNSKPVGMESYLDFWPSAPKANGKCTDAQNRYVYLQKQNGLDYYLTFCLGANYKNYAAGTHTMTSGGIQ